MTNKANPRSSHASKRRMARDPQSSANTERTPTLRRTTKIQQIIDLLRRPDGASIDALAQATGWLPHTTRAALTGIKKRGHAVVSHKLADGTRIYQIQGSVAA